MTEVGCKTRRCNILTAQCVPSALLYVGDVFRIETHIPVNFPAPVKKLGVSQRERGSSKETPDSSVS